MRAYPLNMADYEISKPMYLELKNFCLQYDDKRTKTRVNSVLTSGNINTRQDIETSDTQGLRASRAERWAHDVFLIEETAHEVAGEMACELLRNVTRGIPVSCLEIYCGTNQFYAVRKQFFRLLAEKRGMI